MGNKCSCFNSPQDFRSCDWSNHNIVNPIIPSASSSFKKTNNHDYTNSNFTMNLNNNATDDDREPRTNQASNFHSTNAQMSKNNTSNNNINTTINIISKTIRGYLFRKQYRMNLRNQLWENNESIYTKFIEQRALNENVNNTLNKDPTSISLLTTPYTKYYQNDPCADIKARISQTKTKNGILITYSNPLFSSDNQSECLEEAIAIYKGELNVYTNTKTGFGEWTERDGSKFIGTWVDNVFYGWNKYIDKNGALYIGYFNGNYLNGKGLRYISENNNWYEGDFVNGLREGKGVDQNNMCKYEGDFMGDKKNGRGIVEFESGNIYEGEWKDNKFHGNGHYKWKKNGHEYIGEYEEGLFHGKGLYKWSNVEYYKGDYKKGIKEGNGEMKYPDGKKFTGPFINGKPNGIGMFEDGKGGRWEVEFIDGRINKKYKPNKVKH